MKSKNGVKQIVIDKTSSGQKLFQFLYLFLNKRIPKSALMKWIRTGQVRVDGKRTKPFDRIYEGQVVRIPPYRIEEKNILTDKEKNPFKLKKLHEDKDILVLYKPPNLPTQPGRGIQDSLYTRLKMEYPENTPYLVHRLDKDTSGLILVAKTYNYLKYLQDTFLSHRIKKVYLAWVLGITGWKKWTPIKDTFKEHRDGKTKEVTAISYVKTLRNTENRSLIAVLIKTGRKHQIRIQMSLRKHTIIGEKKYGQVKSRKGLMLHSYFLEWEGHSFSCDPPWMGKYRVETEDLKKIFPLPKVSL